VVQAVVGSSPIAHPEEGARRKRFRGSALAMKFRASGAFAQRPPHVWCYPTNRRVVRPSAGRDAPFFTGSQPTGNRERQRALGSVPDRLADPEGLRRVVRIDLETQASHVRVPVGGAPSFFPARLQAVVSGAPLPGRTSRHRGLDFARIAGRQTLRFISNADASAERDLITFLGNGPPRDPLMADGHGRGAGT
jgi:hypothetical protein